MVFGKKRIVEDDEVVQQSSCDDFVDLVDEEDERKNKADDSQSQGTERDDNPLYNEFNWIGASSGKNPGGAKVWVCKHCGGKFTSSYTRIHTHFFGAPFGKKKAEIKRCPALMKDLRLQKKVKEDEKEGVSKSLKSSIVTKKHNLSSKKPIEQFFSIMERSTVDLKIMRALCANWIPFNVFRNPQFQEMVSAIKKALESYKAPSSEKARTILLDECVRDMEKDLTPCKDTWYSQSLSIVSNGWKNIKHKPLINVLAVKSRGSMFMYAEDFSGVEKTGKEIAEFLTQRIESVCSRKCS